MKNCSKLEPKLLDTNFFHHRFFLGPFIVLILNSNASLFMLQSPQRDSGQGGETSVTPGNSSSGVADVVC